MAALAGLALAAACSSSSTDASGGDGGGGGGGDDAGGVGDTGGGGGGGGGDGGPCVVPPGADPYCAALACPGLECNQSAACQNAHLDQCTATKAATSDAMQSALTACTAQTKCKDLQGFDDCLFPKLLAAPRTSAQTKLAADYCALCGGPDAGTLCTSTFYNADAPFALFVLVYSDAVVADMDAKCGAAGADAGGSANQAQCIQAYGDCVQAVGAAHTPPTPSACN